MALLRLGRYIIDCYFIGVWRCEAPRGEWDDKPLNLDWTPEDCRNCYQCRQFIELPVVRLSSEIKK